MSQEMLELETLAKYCEVDKSTVESWIEKGALKSVSGNKGEVLLNLEDVFSFLKEIDFSASLARRILVVDDEEEICVGMKNILERAGYAVSIAKDGVEAEIIFRIKNPDLVIMDLVMPKTDGFIFYENIRKYESAEKAKFIVLTGYVSKEIHDKVMNLGIDKCIAKPIDKQTLLKEVDEVLKAELLRS